MSFVRPFATVTAALPQARKKAVAGPPAAGVRARDPFRRRSDTTKTSWDGSPREPTSGWDRAIPSHMPTFRGGRRSWTWAPGEGIDTFLASEKVGPSGKVIGVDITPEMVTRARANALKDGYTNVDFRLGEIESLPVADATLDVIISNCVLNLSPERDRVLAEALRVLKPGGRLVISDLVCDVPIPEQLREEAEAVTACLPVEREAYVSQLRAAGFVDVRISAGQRYPREALSSTPIGKRLAAQEPELSASVEAFADSVSGVIIEGRRAD